MTSDPTRRRVLAATGAGTTAALAGCLDLLNDGGNGLEVGTEPELEDDEGITAAIQPSEERMMEIQQEVMAEAEDEDLSQEEVEAAFQERQQEVVLGLAIEFEAAHSGAEDISIEAGIGEQGVFVLTGDSERLLELLETGEVDALLPREQYDEIRAAQDAGGPEPAPEPDETEDDETEPDETEDDDGD
ncbi:hypothetical protein OB905_10940 [Halobacteria archaeon AArc-dxtr1]|nr:hypothetical protein [Halobacteria archaeon AArc-dxtr1]